MPAKTETKPKTDWLARLGDNVPELPMIDAQSEQPAEAPIPKEAPAVVTAPMPPRRRRSGLWIAAVHIASLAQALTVYLIFGRIEQPAPPPAPTPVPPIAIEHVTKPVERYESVVSAKGDGDFQTVAQAVAQAKPGMRIRIKPGVYAEAITLDKPVELVGDGPVSDIVLESQDADALWIKSDGVKVHNLTLRTKAADKKAPVYALHITKGRPLVENCEMTSQSEFCVLVRTIDAQPTLQGCTIRDGSAAGLMITEEAKGLYVDCRILKHAQDGVVIAQGAEPVLLRCTVSECQGSGLTVVAGGRGMMVRCVFSDNQQSGASVRHNDSNVLFRNCVFRDNKTTGFAIRDEAAGRPRKLGREIDRSGRASVVVDKGTRLSLIRCMVRDGKNAGVLVLDGGDATVVGCQINGHDDVGIVVLKGATVSTANHNRLDNNRHGNWTVLAGGVATGTNNQPPIPARAAAGGKPTPPAPGHDANPAPSDPDPTPPTPPAPANGSK